MHLGLFFIFLFFLPPPAYAGPDSTGDVPDYNLKVSFDIQASRIHGLAKISIKKGQELKLHKGDLHLLDFTMNKQKMDMVDQDEVITIFPSQAGIIEVRYTGTFKPPEPSGSISGQGPPRPPSRVIDPRGIFLTGGWYPKVDRLCTYHLTVTLPAGYEAVSEAETIEATKQNGQKVFSFKFPHPLDSVTLIATDRYRVVRDSFNDTEIFAYFFPEDGTLAQAYLERTKKYLKLYESLIGKYPFRRFSIVENFLPTGYSLPTYILLGQEVVKLPFILETSLGHEILHQWFGNLVYVDYEKGNWAEGLTTYLADHLYEEQKGKGFEYRKEALIDYRSYVNEKNEFPLKSFRGRNSRSSQAIGYGKALMVLHMLKNLLGEERFYHSLKSFLRDMAFQKANWDDLQRAFEKNSPEDLRWFFSQWVEEKGLAEFHLEDEVKIRPLEGQFEVAFTITQKERVYTFHLPVSFYSSSGRVRVFSAVDKGRNNLRVLLDDRPHKIVIDEDYDLARTLAENEFPPVIARLLAEDRPILVLPPSGEEVYRTAIEHFKRGGTRIEKAEGVKDGDLPTSSLIILGEKNPLAERLYGRGRERGGFDLTIKKNPWNTRKVIGILRGQSKEEVDAAFPKIFHYGKYSTVSFHRGQNGYKKTETTNRGIVKELGKEATAVDVSAVKDLTEVIRQVADRKIIYVGESHDRFSHHMVQLEIIKALQRKGKKLAIGMEMFQRPFQNSLDDYIGGKIEGKEFLKKTEYFQRWRFDYNLYRPILQFARAEGISVVALNIEREVVEKVARDGLESLSEEEKKLVPSELDFADEAYRERLRKVFQEHQFTQVRNFDFFYQTQILWDETMAESTDSFLKKNPDYQMVVLAGSGHLAFGSGIPNRTARRNGHDYAIILNDAEIEKGVAHYVLFPGTMPMEGSPKLMVSLQEDKGQVSISGFSEGSVSEKAGLQKGDVILSLDQISIHTVEDIRLELLFKKKAEPVKVGILREDPSGGDRKMEFEVILQ